MDRFSRSEYLLLWLVAAGFFMQTRDSTIVTTALPAMAVSLHESPLRMQSVIIAYTLTMAMLIPASGWLEDRLGTRTAFFCAIVVFVFGSALCAASSTLRGLALSRIVQGAGGSMLLPLTLQVGLGYSPLLARLMMVPAARSPAAAIACCRWCRW